MEAAQQELREMSLCACEYQDIGIETEIAAAHPPPEALFNVTELVFPELGMRANAPS